MNSASLILIALLGAIVGSFINALSFRFHTGNSIILGRSKCMRCGHILAAYDLIPIISYLILRGRCRYCRAHISLQYPLVEGIATFLAVGIYTITYTEPLLFAYWFVVWMILLFISIYDMRHAIIPSVCSVILAVLALSHAAFFSVSLTAILAGPLLALPLFLLSLISKGTWMGWGDSALELSLGWLLGIWPGLTALLFGFWIGAGVGVILLFASHRWNRMHSRFTMKSEIPFAPFLILGVAIVYFFHVNIFSSIPSIL